MTEGDNVRLLVALVPIVIVLLLLVLRVPSLWAGAIGVVVAVAGAALAFPLDAAGVFEAASGMGPTMLEVALILLGGVGLAETMRASGAQDRIAGWLDAAERGADRAVTLLLLVFGLTPFMESVTGFGLGVVITAPLLIRIGLPPVKAVVSGLLGLVLVPWGSLGPGTLVAARLGGVDFTALGVWSALLTLPVLVVSMGVVLGLNLGRPTARHLLLGAGVILVEWVVLIGANVVLGPPLAGVLAAGSVMAVLLLLTRRANGPLPAITRPLRRALVPYAVLVAGILASTGLLAATGADHGLGWVASPALWLVIAAGVGLLSLDSSATRRWRIGLDATRRWLPIAANALIFLLLGVVMAATGMAEHLAATAAQAGHGFVVAIPAIGALGGYLTGSNTGAAAMFSTATTSAASQLGVDELIVLAGQNVAASLAIIASPPRIALATGVALAAGQRLPVRAVRALLAPVAVVAAVLGVVVLAIA